MIENERIMDFFNACKVGEKLFFYGRDDVGLCCFDLKSGYLEVNLLSEDIGGSIQFYKYTDSKPTKENILNDMGITPPGIDISQKYYIGFYENSTMGKQKY